MIEADPPPPGPEDLLIIEALGAIVGDMVEAIAEVDDVVSLDALAASFVAFDDPEAPPQMLELLVAHVVAGAGPAALEFLSGVARLAGEPMASVALGAVARQGSVTAPPALAGGAGTLEVLETRLVAADELDVFVLLLGRPGHPDRQPGLVAIERGAGGALAFAGLGEPDDAPPDGDPLKALNPALLSSRGARSVGRAALAARLRAAISSAEAREMVFSTQTATDLVLLARAATGEGGLVRGLLVDPELDEDGWPEPEEAEWVGPPPGARQPRRGASAAALGRAAATDGDAEAPVGEAELEVDLERDGEEERFAALQDRLLGELEAWMRADVPHGPIWDHADFIAATMLDWKAGYGDGELARWTAEDLAEYLLVHFPRKITTEDETLDHVVDCALVFLRFLEWRGSLRGDLLVALVRAAKALREPFLEHARDRRAWGPAKSLGRHMLDDGVDPDDQTAVERWMTAFNDRPRAERDAALGDVAGAMTAPGGGRSNGATRRTRTDAQRRDKRRAEKKARKRGRR